MKPRENMLLLAPVISATTRRTIVLPLTKSTTSYTITTLNYHSASLVQIGQSCHRCRATITTSNSQKNPCSSKTKTPQPSLSSSLPSPTMQTRQPSKMQQAKAAPKKLSFWSRFFDALEDIINTHIDPPICTSSTDMAFSPFSRNYAPVDELAPTKCEVLEGSIPACLNGAYIRIGPNPKFHPLGPYHYLDGDGMLHCIRISKDGVTLSSRFVRTNKFNAEQREGTSLAPYLTSAATGRLVGFIARVLLSFAKMLVWRFNLSNGVGPANTNLALIGSKLYALHELDLPYQIRVTMEGEVKTIGRCNEFGGGVLNMTAHPKVDPETGEVFAFRYFITPPCLTYFRFNSHGNKLADVPIFSMQIPSLVHDFAITKKYAIFPDIQFRLLATLESAIGFDAEKVPRLGVIPRYAKDGNAIRWFDVPGFNVFHAVNAWDEEGDDEKKFIALIAPNLLSIEHCLARIELTHGLMEIVKIDLESSTVTRQPLSTKNLELGVINPTYLTKRCRYVYASILANHIPHGIIGVVKLDVAMAEGDDKVEDCTVASRIYGPGCHGGEVFFVPKEPTDSNNAEDDGYLVSYIHDENCEESRFIVMDPKTPMLDIVASVKLPQRVPFGFHGLFVSENDLQKL